MCPVLTRAFTLGTGMPLAVPLIARCSCRAPVFRSAVTGYFSSLRLGTRLVQALFVMPTLRNADVEGTHAGYYEVS